MEEYWEQIGRGKVPADFFDKIQDKLSLYSNKLKKQKRQINYASMVLLVFSLIHLVLIFTRINNQNKDNNIFITYKEYFIPY